LDRTTSRIYLDVDLIRTLAIVLVILLHVSIEPHPIVTQIGQAEVVRWWTVDFYESIAQLCVPLFVLLSGALLLQPSKIDEPLGVFFKKRVNRIALPFVFWGAAYFAWRYFVNHEALTIGSILQGIETGPYFHFWFLYMIAGLYLITPILRVLIAHADRKLLTYLIVLWFVGTAIMPFIGLFGSYDLDTRVFVIVGWVGYFLLGAILLRVRLRPLVLYVSLAAGVLATAVGTYFMTLEVGGQNSYFFDNELSVTIIVASIAMFMLLRNFSANRLEKGSPHSNWLLHQISKNTLAIYLFHVMVLESLERGFFGFTLSVNTINPILGIPLITAVTLFISLGVIILLKKIPLLKKVIG
jgi:surface polysaccharide O-acyltransferase-like enzyme